jgi:DeoR/GlpR family transcriptional regulator of sugar metabolism
VVGVDGSLRLERTAELLRRDGRVDVGDLAREFATSEVTVRRDLDLLAERGLATRIRGGAITTVLRGDEVPFAVRQLESAPTKDRMAAAVSELIREGEAVIVDGGTTGLAVARVLAPRRLTVLPLSLQGASALAAGANVNLLLPGGTVRSREGTFVGPATEANLAQLRFDTLVMTCCGMSATGGVTAIDLQDGAVKRAAMASASRSVLVAESAKFTRTALSIVCPLEAVDILVTDTDAPPAAVAAARDLGVEVILA